MNLTDDQQKAMDEILAAQKPGKTWLLLGAAGTGKTTLIQQLCQIWKSKSLDVVVTAPTHKAVAVLERKLKEAGLEGIGCCTIHRLLGLKPKPDGDKMLFVRDRRAEPVDADIVVIDEASMLQAELMAHIRRGLTRSFVLYAGDKAQLPPVGEIESQAFGVKSRSVLNEIVRQAAGNPILTAAHAIRANQGQPMDWSWMVDARDGDRGVFVPKGGVEAWLKKAFTSPEFDADAEKFRYLCWTNARVSDVNAKVRRWRYGENIPTPFMPGERAMFRAPVIRDGDTLFGTNEEATVLSIERSVFQYEFEAVMGVDGWTAEVPSWQVVLDKDGAETAVHMPQSERDFERVANRVKDEAGDCRDRWGHLHEFKAAMARLQSVYCMTVHCSQGSTFGWTFCDVQDIRKREKDNLLEAQQLMYTAVTRAAQGLVLVGAH